MSRSKCTGKKLYCHKCGSRKGCNYRGGFDLFFNDKRRYWKLGIDHQLPKYARFKHRKYRRGLACDYLCD